MSHRGTDCKTHPEHTQLQPFCTLPAATYRRRRHESSRNVQSQAPAVPSGQILVLSTASQHYTKANRHRSLPFHVAPADDATREEDWPRQNPRHERYRAVNHETEPVKYEPVGPVQTVHAGNYEHVRSPGRHVRLVCGPISDLGPQAYHLL
ncbi:hypothetical protein E2P81_ATG02245 [Venturia nashicola]|uniref:Uncharacterized protein n=1 Tax=Venturia nashicola TaxID=86259 RepID=A0A4Z1P676_9PEZI|nr:hypothetical protein E6O75_ATG02302 [Venturia nashicola]TLD35942.1 hypothetical protein E2P81_ATG02245 [Venturia nashicola]